MCHNSFTAGNNYRKGEKKIKAKRSFIQLGIVHSLEICGSYLRRHGFGIQPGDNRVRE